MSGLVEDSYGPPLAVGEMRQWTTYDIAGTGALRASNAPVSPTATGAGTRRA